MDYLVYSVSELMKADIPSTLDSREENEASQRGDAFRRIRSLLKRELSRRCGLPTSEIHFSYGAHGKPSVPQLEFNISHSDDCLCMAFHHAPIGIDVEKIRPRAMERLAPRFMAAEQLRAFRERGSKTEEFFACWCAAEALVKRLWCSVHADGDSWKLVLPQALHEPLLKVISDPETLTARERLFRFDATIHGLLYIAGFLHVGQPMGVMLSEVMRRNDPLAVQVARRYLQASFEYITDANGDLILLHPGLADPYRMVGSQPVEGVFTLELSQELIAGAMNGILPEEIPLHDMLCGALNGALRPEYDMAEAAQDLRMLAKQGVSLPEMEYVMSSMLAVLPTQRMKDALLNLYRYTPHWMGLKPTVMQ